MLEPVMTDTVGQYTGLTDKNGKKIFEGDIVGVGECDKIYEKVVVYFDKGAFRVSQFAIDLLETRNIDCEVIGNIYDNPELLEEQENEQAAMEKESTGSEKTR